MGLLTTVRKIKEKEKEMRILFLGLDNAGKTTVVKSIMKKDVNKISPTLGFTIDSFEHNGFTVNAWDVGGQRSIRPYWKNYFEKTEGIVWVVDSADRSRLHDCSEELKSVLSEQRLLGASLLILANKQDIDSAASLAEIAKVRFIDVGTGFGVNMGALVENICMQCNNRGGSDGGDKLGSRRYIRANIHACVSLQKFEYRNAFEITNITKPCGNFLNLVKRYTVYGSPLNHRPS
ncbi:hypothetical protein BB559_001010 [Furculomyces boomerangus]|uniref:ADP-ribosylation factor n=1 Tax=Furculomyces boomerangus TaxID=61424 RepID=A0A2T9Z3B7_9FUNG|nr:hypothetical protein BB559_001010 [Furculomyces boomerangus]